MLFRLLPRELRLFCLLKSASSPETLSFQKDMPICNNCNNHFIEEMPAGGSPPFQQADIGSCECLLKLDLSADNLREETVDMNTGKSSYGSDLPSQWVFASKLLPPKLMSSLQGQKLPSNTSGRKTPVLPVRSSSLGSPLSNAMKRPIGMMSENMPNLANWTPSLPTCMSDATTNCVPSKRRILPQQLWNGKLKFFGDQPVPEKVEELGMKPDWTPTRKTREQNFGTDTIVKRMLFQMSSEGLLMLVTYFAGSTGIPYWQKSREVAVFWLLNEFG